MMESPLALLLLAQKNRRPLRELQMVRRSWWFQVFPYSFAVLKTRELRREIKKAVRNTYPACELGQHLDREAVKAELEKLYARMMDSVKAEEDKSRALLFTVTVAVTVAGALPKVMIDVADTVRHMAPAYVFAFVVLIYFADAALASIRAMYTEGYPIPITARPGSSGFVFFTKVFRVTNEHIISEYIRCIRISRLASESKLFFIGAALRSLRNALLVTIALYLFLLLQLAFGITNPR